METEGDTPMASAGTDLKRAAFRRSLSRMNLSLSPYEFETAFARVSTSSARTGRVTDSQVRAIVNDVVSSSEILQGVTESFR